MSLRIRRGTNAQRLTTTLDLGEIGYTTDTQKLYAGDGVSAGGRHVLASSAGNGLFFNETSQQLDLSVGALTLTTADITESSSLYFTQARAQAAVAAAFTAGQSLGNVTFSYDDTTAKIYANVTPDGVGIMSVSEDTAPVLGGNLTLGGHDIVGSGNLTVVGALTATSYTGAILLTNDNISGTGNIDITGEVTASTFNGAVALNNHNISGTGNVNITGNVLASSYSGAIALNNNNISGTGNINITGAVISTTYSGAIVLDNDDIGGIGNIYLTGAIFADSYSGAIILNNHNISGTGNVNITGNILATSYSGAITLNNNNISGTGNVNITGNILATSYSGAITLTNDDISGTGNVNITGNILATSYSGAITLNNNNISGTGNVNITGNILATSYSGAITLNNHNISGTGNIDITGSVTADSYSGAVVLTSQDITGTGNINVTGNITTNGIISNNSVSLENSKITTSSTLVVESSAGSSILRIVGTIQTGNNSWFDISATRGSLEIPTALVAGDTIGGIRVNGWDGTSYKGALALVVEFNDDAVFTDEFPSSTANIALGNGETPTFYSFNNVGSFTAPASITPGTHADAATRDALIITPLPGMITFMIDIQKFQGYVSDTGIAAGGAASSTPGWISLN
jgi:hypothetical protein